MFLALTTWHIAYVYMPLRISRTQGPREDPPNIPIIIHNRRAVATARDGSLSIGGGGDGSRRLRQIHTNARQNAVYLRSNFYVGQFGGGAPHSAISENILKTAYSQTASNPKRKANINCQSPLRLCIIIGMYNPIW